MRSRLIASLGLLAAIPAPAITVLPTVASAADRPVVVELFTSQGCSSCPPANAYLNEMVRSRRDVLPLAFHVTYWDRLGWKDPFSLEAATARQAGYGRRFGDGSYTPEIVVDGVSSHVGSDRAEVGAAIDKARQGSETAASVSVSRNGAELVIEVGGGKGSGRVLLIGFDHDHQPRSGAAKTAGARSLKPMWCVRSARSATGRDRRSS